jgi:alpha-glucosidase
MMRSIILAIFFSVIGFTLHARKYEIQSPDQIIQVTINIKDNISYSVSYQGIPIIDLSHISLTIGDNNILGQSPNVIKVETSIINDKIYPPIKGKRKEIIDRYNEIEFSFSGRWGLVFRVYNDGICWRFVTRINKEITILNEEAAFHFTNNDTVFIPLVNCGNNPDDIDCFHSSYEELYRKLPVSEVASDIHGLLPSLIYQSDNSP